MECHALHSTEDRVRWHPEYLVSRMKEEAAAASQLAAEGVCVDRQPCSARICDERGESGEIAVRRSPSKCVLILDQNRSVFALPHHVATFERWARRKKTREQIHSPLGMPLRVAREREGRVLPRVPTPPVFQKRTVA